MYKNYGPLCATVYDLTKPVGSHLNGDVDYYKERLRSLSGPILEIGVGTGRMMIPLLTAGHQVTGIDLSPDMLDTCRRNMTNAGVTGELIEADFTVDLPHRSFDAIIIPTATLNLITDHGKVQATIDRFFQILTPGGKLILDLDLPFYPEIGETQTTTFPLSSQSGILMESKTIDINWVTQSLVSHIRYEKWTEGQLVASELQDLTLHWFGIEECQLMLQAAGFTSITVTGDYDYLSPVTDANQTITLEAYKAP